MSSRSPRPRMADSTLFKKSLPGKGEVSVASITSHNSISQPLIKIETAISNYCHAFLHLWEILVNSFTYYLLFWGTKLWPFSATMVTKQSSISRTKSSLHKIWSQCNMAPSNNDTLLSTRFKCRKVNWEASLTVFLFLSQTWHGLEIPIHCCDSCQLAILVGKAHELNAGCFKLEQHHHVPFLLQLSEALRTPN